jgi:hypothetical protein
MNVEMKFQTFDDLLETVGITGADLRGQTSREPSLMFLI